MVPYMFSLPPHAEHFVAERVRHVRLPPAVVQHHVDQALASIPAPPVCDAGSSRSHQDVFAEVLGRQAEVDEGGAER